MPAEPRRLRILTWQVHGNYLWYLTQAPHDFWLVTRPGHPPGYAGRTPSFPWAANVHELAEAQVRQTPFDCVLYQSRAHWEQDRHSCLSPQQRRLPSLYLEHDPPQRHPTDTAHWAQEADLIVHVTPFNALMWDCADAAVRVIEHGVAVPDEARYGGGRAAGLVAINHLHRRGRRLGADVYERVRTQVPLALAGMDSAGRPGGLGEIPNLALPAVMGAFRFLFQPIRWTSLSLALLEAMSVGLPVVALATTEISTVIANGDNGWADTDPARLIEVMNALLVDPVLARRWGENARRTARQRFGIERFVADWNQAFASVTARRS